ncbi:MAG: hypothetical protein JJU20_13790 [Opitutales bacterium]|nr:hypothetical protein [Opitutales bacterium]
MAAPVPQSPQELLACIRELGIDKTCSRFRRPPLPSLLLRELKEQADTEGLYFIARYSLSPSDLLESLAAQSDDAQLMRLLAANPRTPPPILLGLIEHPIPEVRGAVAINPNLTPREILKLLRDDHAEVVEALAQNPGLKIQHQAFLLRHPNASVRHTLAQNHHLDPQILRALGDDPDPDVRRQVAALSKADANQLQLWADSDDEALQTGLLERKKLDDSLIRSLALSAHVDIRTAVESRFELQPEEWVFRMDHGDPQEQLRLAAWREIPSAIQRNLCQKESLELRAQLAANPRLDDAIAEFLTQSGEPDIGLALLDNPRHQPEWLDALAQWGHPLLDAALTYATDAESALLHELINVRLSAEATVQLSAQGKAFPALRSDLAAALVRHNFPALRALAAGSQQLAPALLRQLANDPIKTVAQAARSNPNFRPNDPPSEPALSHSDQRIRSWIERIDHCLENPLKPSIPSSV